MIIIKEMIIINKMIYFWSARSVRGTFGVSGLSNIRPAHPIYLSIYIYIYIYIIDYKYIYIYIYIYFYIYTYNEVYIYIYIHMYNHILCIHIYIYIYIYHIRSERKSTEPATVWVHHLFNLCYA